MAIRVTLQSTNTEGTSTQVTVESACAYSTNATGGAGLVADLFESAEFSVPIATFGHVLYVENLTFDVENKPYGPDNPQYINGG